MIHLLLGADEYLAAEWLAAKKATLGSPEIASLNLVELNGSQSNAATVLGEAAMLPFLAEGRLVVVRGLLDSYDKRLAASKSSEAAIYGEMARFLEGIRSVPETCILVLGITLWISVVGCGKDIHLLSPARPNGGSTASRPWGPQAFSSWRRWQPPT